MYLSVCLSVCACVRARARLCVCVGAGACVYVMCDDIKVLSVHMELEAQWLSGITAKGLKGWLSVCVCLCVCVCVCTQGAPKVSAIDCC